MPLPCLTFDYQRVVAGMSIMKAATEPTGFRMGCCTWPPLFLSYLLTYVKCGKCSHMSHSKPSVDGLRSYTNLLTGLIMKWIVNEHGSHLEVSIHAGTPVRIHFLCGILHEINHPAIGVPSGIQKTMENHNFSWVNPL